jgi:hypothetical protein
MTNAIGSGLGLGLEPGDHVCAFYAGTAERDKLLLPYLRDGLRARNKCLCIVDSPPHQTMVANIAEGLDDPAEVDRSVASRQLELLRSIDSYTRGGSFSTLRMMDFFREAVEGALSGGYEMVRITGEPAWLALGPPGVEEFIDYEVSLNDFAPQYPQVILCLYDLERFGGGMVVDIMRTHKKLVLGGLVLDNPHYLSPDEFRATRR